MTPTPAPGSRRAWAAVAIAVPLLVVAYHWRAARPGWAFAASDLRYFFYGVREAVAESLRRGELPWWQRGIFLGYPLVADPQAAVFDPATWLTLPWDAPRALTLATLLHLAVAGWGMAFWLRLRGLAPAEALLGAVLFALGAKETVHVVHWNFAATTAWWPWMLAGLEGFAADGRGRHLLLAACASALSWLGGSPQMAYFGWIAAGLHAVVLAPGLWRRRRLDAVLALAAVPAGLFLAAPGLLPALELSRWGPRGSGVDYAFATSWKWPDRWALSLFLLPGAFGSGHHGGTPWESMNLWEVTGYLGVLPLGLAAAAPLRRRGLWPFLALGLLGVWLGFGEDAWLGMHRLLFRVLPGYSSFRVPTRFLMVTLLASALLAAEGLAALRREPGGRTRRTAAVLAAVAVVAPILPHLPAFPLDPAAARTSAVAAAALAAAALVWLAAGARLGRGPALALAAIGLCLLDLYLAFGDMNPVARASDERPLLSEVEPLLPRPPSPRRVAVLAKWGRTANAPLRQGFEGATGYGPMCVERVRFLLEGTRDNRVVPPAPVKDDTNFPRPRPASALWPLLSTPVVVSDEPQPLPVLGATGREWERPLVAYRAPALPRVFWTGAFELASDADAGPLLLPAARGDRAVLAEPPPGLAASGPPQGPLAAERIEVGRRSLSATLDAPRAGVAVILDPYYPGWRATLDGAPVPLIRADYAFQAVPLPAGRHLLRLEYENPLVLRGALVSGATLLLILGILLTRRRVRRR